MTTWYHFNNFRKIAEHVFYVIKLTLQILSFMSKVSNLLFKFIFLPSKSIKWFFHRYFRFSPYIKTVALKTSHLIYLIIFIALISLTLQFIKETWSQNFDSPFKVISNNSIKQYWGPLKSVSKVSRIFQKTSYESDFTTQ